MMTKQFHLEGIEVNKTHRTEITEKIERLSKSVSNVYKYELLTTNQYLQQMELVLEILNDLSDTNEIIHATKQ